MNNNGENEKLEWMYKSKDLLNRDEYLLGRKVDKSFEILQEEEQKKDAVGVKKPINHVEHDVVPLSIREYRNVQSTEQVDLQRKTMEDPLMLIRQREIETRRKILENPVKLKQLHNMMRGPQENLDKKDKKKSKRRRKRSPLNAEDKLDKKIRNCFKKIRANNSSFKIDDLLNLLSGQPRSSSKGDKITKSKDQRRGASSSSTVSSENPNRHDERDNKYKYSVRTSSTHKTTQKREKYSSPRREHQNTTYEPRRNYSNHPTSTSNVTKTKLSEEAKAERLRKMMEEGERRNVERTRDVHKYREAYAREEAEHQGREFDKQFINKEVRKAIEKHDSISSRIRSNINNIQRSQLEMNKNFARK